MKKVVKYLQKKKNQIHYNHHRRFPSTTFIQTIISAACLMLVSSQNKVTIQSSVG
jgi:hypothetical protein